MAPTEKYPFWAHDKENTNSFTERPVCKKQALTFPLKKCEKNEKSKLYDCDACREQLPQFEKHVISKQ